MGNLNTRNRIGRHFHIHLVLCQAIRHGLGNPGIVVNDEYFFLQEQPLVVPQVSHLRQVPLRTMVNCPHSRQGSPS